VADDSLGLTPFTEIPRHRWAQLAPTTPSPLEAADIDHLRGLGDTLDMDEVQSVYMPLSRLIALYALGAKRTHASTSEFLGTTERTTPFVVGVAGSVAVGKSTISRVLRELLSRFEETPNVALITTDGFLFPNDELERRGIAHRKGFPESYDRRSLLRFVTKVKSGAAQVSAPVYSHMEYDIVPGEFVTVSRPDILIVEGLNVLQPPRGDASLAVSDLFDFTIYVDARTSDIEKWYVERFLQLQGGAFADPRSHFHKYASLTRDEAVAEATSIWKKVNEPNLIDNIAPTRSRAQLILRKGANHTVSTVLLRKI
jgi:type I pantothenate kinase